MVQKKHLYSIFIPAIFLVLAVFSFRLFQYITIFTSPFDQDDVEQNQTFTIPLSENDPIIGDKKAPKTIVAFEDAQCAHCASFYTLMKEFEKIHPNTVKIIWKPTSVITIPFSSETAHTYLMCAKEQNAFIPYLELLFANQVELSKESLDLFAQNLKLNITKLNACLTDTKIQTYISETKQLAQYLQIQSVPALFLNNIQIPVPATIVDLEGILNISSQ